MLDAMSADTKRGAKAWRLALVVVWVAGMTSVTAGASVQWGAGVGLIVAGGLILIFGAEILRYLSDLIAEGM